MFSSTDIFRSLFRSHVRKKSNSQRSGRRKRSPQNFEHLEPRLLLTVNTMTAYDQLALELVNRARMDPAAEASRQGIDLNQGLSPGTISTTPKQPLAPHQILHDIALAHSQDMIDNNYFSHTNQQGESPQDRADAAGYEHSVGENLAFRGTGGTLDQLETTYGMHDDLYASPSHRENTFADSYTEAGISHRFGDYTHTDNNTYDSGFVTHNYGNPSTTYITGVIYTDTDTDGMYSVGEGADGGTVTIVSESADDVSFEVSSVGGYAAEVANGDYTVLYSQGGSTWIVENVSVVNANEKVDFELNTALTRVNLSVSLADSSISENGGSTTGTVSRQIASISDYVVSLSSSGPISLPSTVTIPAGQTSATFPVTAVDDAVLTGTQTADVTADGTAAQADTEPISVTDYENSITLNGTSANDQFEFVFTAHPSQFQLTLNSVSYDFEASSPTIALDGLGGMDSFDFDGSFLNDTINMDSREFSLTSSAYSVAGDSMEVVRASLGGGTDIAYIDGEAGVADSTVLKEDQAWSSNATSYNYVDEFEEAYATGDEETIDSIQIYGTTADDTIDVSGATQLTTGGGIVLRGNSYGTVNVYANSGGNDTATVTDTSGDDVYRGYPTYGQLETQWGTITLTAVDTITVTASEGGDDTARLYDGANDDTFRAGSTDAEMYGTGFWHTVNSFDTVVGYSTTGGTDRAYFEDTAGDDRFIARPTASYMLGSTFFNYASNFEEVVATATNGGNDRADLYDSSGDEVLVAAPTYSYMSGSGFYNYVAGYEIVRAYAASGGTDTAQFYDSPNDDILVARFDYTYMVGSGFDNYAAYFDETYSYATAGGVDSVQFYDSVADDYYIAKEAYAYMRTQASGSPYYNYAAGFESTVAYSVFGGSDRAQLYDTVNDDAVDASSVWARMTTGNGITHRAQYFSRVDAYSTQGGTDTSEELSELDFLFYEVGNWI